MKSKEIPGTKPTGILTKNQDGGVSYQSLETTPMDLIKLAVSQDFDIAKLKELMALQKEWKADRAREEFNAAMSRFQSVVPDMQKNRKVNYQPRDQTKDPIKYNYQDLGSIASHIKESLAECGLSYRWEQEEAGGKVSVTCILSHSGGHVERGKPLTAQADESGGKQGIHRVGSTITYLKRYTLVAILGLTSSEMDDDGQAAVRKNGASKNTEAKVMSEDELKEVIKMVRKGHVQVSTLKEAYNLTAEQIETLELAEKNAKA